MAAATTHVFAHLGTSPFRVVAYSPRDPGCGTACDHCGTYIVNVFKIQDAKGRTFQVGSSCVEKTGDSGLKQTVKNLRKAVQDAKRREQWAEQQKIWAKNEAEAEKVRQVEAKKAAKQYDRDYKTASILLAKRPHPNAYFASKGKTMLDYLRYFEEQNGRDSFRVRSIINETIKKG